MARREYVKGYEQFRRLTAQFEGDSKSKMVIYFMGDRNDGGISWCPDCAKVDPIINRALELYSKPDVTFLTVEVGDRNMWKNAQNPFRHDPEVKIGVIPTMIVWKGVERLEDEQCGNLNLLELFFTEICT